MDYKELLVGARLKNVNDRGITVIDTKGKEYTLDFIKNDGDWCGYADVTANLLITQDELKNNPIISDVEIEGTEGDSSIEITLCGVSKQIAKIHCEAGSGSGWAYGATVSIACEPLNFENILCVW